MSKTIHDWCDSSRKSKIFNFVTFVHFWEENISILNLKFVQNWFLKIRLFTFGAMFQFDYTNFFFLSRSFLKLKMANWSYLTFINNFILVVFSTLFLAVKSQYLDSDLLDDLASSPRLFGDALNSFSVSGGNVTLNLFPFVFYTFAAFLLGTVPQI